ncbi:MAG TPA: HEAT repeat domain-containing protein, partial [Polyangiaceae bacterium]
MRLELNRTLRVGFVLLSLASTACQKRVLRDGRPKNARVDQLVLQLTEPNEDMQRAALQSLTELGPLGARAIPAVARVVESAHGALRGEAAVTLVALAPGSHQAISGVEQVLRDSDAEVRELGAIALGLLGPAGAPAYGLVQPLVSDSSPDVRAAAGYAVLKVQPSEANIQLGYRMLESDEPRARFMALRGLRELGAGAVRQLPPIIAAIPDANVGTAIEAIRVLQGLGERAQPATQALLAALERAEVAEQALRALVTIDHTGEVVLPALRQCITGSASAEARARAVEGLANYPKAVSENILALVLALKDEDTRVATTALFAVSHLKPDYAAVRAALVGLVSHGAPALSWKAAEVMASYDASGEDLVQLQSGSKRARLQAAYALGKLTRSEAVEHAL